MDPNDLVHFLEIIGEDRHRGAVAERGDYFSARLLTNERAAALCGFDKSNDRGGLSRHRGSGSL